MAFSVKAHLYHPSSLRPSVHRLELTKPFTYDDLVEKLESVLDAGSLANLRWRDDENDLIVLKSDDDLRLAVGHVEEIGRKSLSVHAEVVLKPEAAPHQVPCTMEGEAVEATSGATTTGRQVSRAKTAHAAARRQSEGYPMRELPGGGKYCGYVRTTDAEGKTVERELTWDEAQDMIRAPVMAPPPFSSGLDDLFGWPAFRRPQHPSLEGYRPGRAYTQPLLLPYFY